MPVSEPNDLYTSANLFGTLSNTAQSITSTVSGADLDDWFYFDLTAPGAVNITLSGLTQDIDLYLGNSSLALLGVSNAFGAANESITTTTLAAGRYYIDVNNFSGAPSNYTLSARLTTPAAVDNAGNTPGLARAVGTLGATTLTFTDAVNTGDVVDWYSFNTTGLSNFTLALGGMTADADVYLVGSDQSTILASSFNSGTLAESIRVNGLAGGVYYVAVAQFTGNTNYTLSMSAPSAVAPDFAGNTTTAARDIGTLGASAGPFSDFVGTADTQDFYRFSITERSSVGVALGAISGGDADVALLGAAGNQIAFSNASGTANELISQTLEAGTYYVRVYQFSGNASYQLSMTRSSAAATDAGGGFAADLSSVSPAANSFGVLGSTPTSRSDFVGNADPRDLYSFSLNGTSNVSLALTGLANDADVLLLDSGRNTIAYSNNWGSLSEQINATGLAAGTYYVAVYQYAGDTAYTLTASASGFVAPDLAGNTQATARVVSGLSSTPVFFNDVVGAADTNDFYQFTLGFTSSVIATVAPSGGNADLQILSAAGVVLQTAAVNGFDSIDGLTLGAGTYYVRVFPTAGPDASYSLGLAASQVSPVGDGGGNSAGSPTALGTIGTTVVTRTDAVGDFDQNDWYSLSLAGAAQLRVNLSGLSADADVEITDAAGTSVFGYSINGGANAEQITASLGAGDYRVHVYQYAGNTNYTLSVNTLTAIADNAGNTQAAARLVTLSAAAQTFNDFMGGGDQDWYRFTTTATSSFALAMTGLSGNADVELLNSLGAATGFSSANAGNASEFINVGDLAAGTYYVRVTGADSTPYGLTMSTAPSLALADNTTAGAIQLGAIPLGATAVTRTDNVGSGDTQDFYRITIGANPNLRLTMTGLTADADVAVLGAAGNVLASSVAAGSASESISLNGLAAGNYFVRVYQYAGNTNYTLNVRAEAPAVVDGAGNTAAAARVLPALTATPQVFNDFVGAADGFDYYRFTTAAASTISIRIDGMTADADVYLLGSNGTTQLAFSDAGGSAQDAINFATAAGTYYVRVQQFAGDTNYRLTLSAQAAADNSGNTAGAATNLGAIGAVASVTSGFVGSSDRDDWFTFTTGYTSNFRLLMNGMTSDADVQLLAADGTSVLGWSYAAGTAAESISLNNLAAGTYYAHVSQYAGNTNYNLSLQAQAPADTAGNTAAASRALTLSGTPTVINESVGSVDAVDFYKFTLTQRSEVSLALSGLTGNADLQLFTGTNAATLLGTSAQLGLTNETLGFSQGDALNAGTYYIRVAPAVGQNANYTLTASAEVLVPADTAGNSTVAARQITVGATDLSINEFVGTSTSPADAADFYRFSLAAASGLRLQLTGMGVDPAQVSLLDAAGNALSASRTTATGGAFAQFDRLDAGTYFINVTPATGGATYAPYTMAVRSVGADDYAEGIATTGRVSVGATPATGSVENAGDVDWFRVNLTAGTRYNVSLQGTSAGGTLQDTVIRGLFAANGTPIDGTFNDNSAGSTNSLVTFTPGATGDYFIAAGAFASFTGTYRLSVSTTNQAPVVGVTLAAQDAREGQPFSLRLPWQLFTDPENSPITITADQSDGRPLPAWLLYDPNSQTLSGTPALNSPDITVRLTGSDGSLSASTSVLIRTLGALDDYASTTATSGALAVGGTARGNIETVGDQDWFAISLIGGTQYTIDQRGAPGAGGTLPDTYLRVFNSAGTQVAFNDDTGTRDSRIDFTPGSSGTFYVSGGAYGSNTGTYLLSVTAGSSNHAPTVQTPIEDQHAREGVAFSYTVPQNTFADQDNNPLAYSVAGTLPTWLQFNAATRTFTGTAPANSADVVLTVNATDPGGLSASSRFTLLTDAAVVGGPVNPAPIAQQDRWTLMIYMAADNNLEPFALSDLQEMELVNLPSNVNVVVMMDRAPGYSTAEGNWTDTRRGQVTYHTASSIGSTLTSVGELNTGSPTTLTDFINWGAANYRAEHYGVVIWDHGGGLSGTSWDDTNGSDNLSIAETTRAIQNSTLGRLDFLGFDTCLQGMIEQADDVRTVAGVVVASQKVEPGDGWNYTGWLQPFVSNANLTALQVGTNAVTSYDAFYSSPETLTAIDSSLVDEITTAINAFTAAAVPLLGGNNATLDEQRLRAAANAATMVYDNNAAYRDLGNFMQRIAADTSVTSGVRTAATNVFNAVDAATYASTSVSGFNGLSVYLPNTAAGAQSPDYTSSNYRFLADTNWRGFLTALNS